MNVERAAMRIGFREAAVERFGPVDGEPGAREPRPTGQTTKSGRAEGREGRGADDMLDAL